MQIICPLQYGVHLVALEETSNPPKVPSLRKKCILITNIHQLNHNIGNGNDVNLLIDYDIHDKEKQQVDQEPALFIPFTQTEEHSK